MGTDTVPAPRCRGCDYALNDLPQPRCPECGRAFDLADARTYHTGRPMPPWLRSWVQPFGWKGWTVAGVAWLIVSRLAAEPVMNYMCFGPVIFFILVWPVVLLSILARASARSAIVRFYGRSPGDFGSEGGGIRLIVIAFALLHFCTGVTLPTRLWFLPFAGGFESAADEVRAMTPAGAWLGRAPLPSQTRWIGPWRVTVQGVRGEPGVVACYTDGGALPGGGSGFLHLDGRGEMIGYNYGEDGWLIGDWHYFVTD